MRIAEILTAWGLLLLAGIAFAEAVRLGFGYGQYGPEAGFLIFWLALVTVICAVAIMHHGWRMKGREDFFLNRPATLMMAWVALTMFLFGFGVRYLGAYIAMGMYAALFSAWLGGHRWYAVLAFAILTPVIILFAFERNVPGCPWSTCSLQILLPKSPVYVRGWLPFCWKRYWTRRPT